MTSRIHAVPSPSQQQVLAYDPLLDDIGYMTCMTLVLLGNYAQTGHLGGPLAYTPYNVAAHLVESWKMADCATTTAGQSILTAINS